jgi:PAS domain S-box-containing protein
METSLPVPSSRDHGLFEGGSVGMFRTGSGGRVLDCNAALARILGLESAAALLGRNASEFYWTAGDRDALLERLRRERAAAGVELRLRRPNGDAVWVLADVRLAEDEPGTTQGVVIDVTARVRAEARIVRLGRVCSVLSHVGRAIVRIGDRGLLLAEVCRIAVDDGGLRMAWFGVPDEAAKTIAPVAHYGRDGDPEPLPIPVPAGRGVLVSRDPALLPSHTLALLPVVVKDCVEGVLALYAEEPDFFDEQTVELVSALADDLAVALDNMEREAGRRRDERERARLYVSEQAAHAQARASARYRELLEAAPDAILESDAEGRILVANAAAESLFGYSREELLEKRIEDLVPESFRSAGPGSQSIGGARRIPAFRKDGTEFPVEISLNPVKAEQGGLVTCIVRDITARMQAEDALRESEGRIGRILESITDAFFAVDREWRFTYLNRRAEQTLGRRREELEGKRLYDEFPELAGSLFYQELQRAAAGERPIEFTAPYAPLKLWLDVHVYPSANGLSVYIQDVTMRKLLEERSQQSQRLEALGRLAGEVAHDFNNLLTIIGGYSQIALESIDKSQGALRHDVEIVAEAASRASTLTRQLLAFGRRQVVQPRVLDLNRLITKTARMLKRMIRADIDLRLLLRPDLGRVKADPGQIEQVVMNLAVNARDAMPLGGALSIVTENRQVSGEAENEPRLAPGSYVMLAVSDTGTGLDREARDHLFEPFFTTKPRGKGTGLGLATVYGAVKQSGGEIWVDSEPGRGTRFEIYLPRASKIPKPRRERPSHPAPRGGTETILLVEDEPEVRKLASIMLAGFGYRVLEAAGPSEALAVWETSRGAIDLLLTDVIMPQTSGRELADQMAAFRPGLKVLYMTGYTEDVILLRGVEAGKVDLLQKPFSREALGLRVRSILDSGPGGRSLPPERSRS